LKEPKLEIWIDAHNEKFNEGELKSIIYEINNLEQEDVKIKLFEAVGMLVYEIRVISEKEGKIEIAFYENLISPTFIDYRLRLRGLKFSRKND
jgi:phage-related protein